MSSKKSTLHQLLAFADKFAQEQFRDDGEVRSFWLCETGAAYPVLCRRTARQCGREAHRGSVSA